MTFDPALSAMMAEPWSNGACPWLCDYGDGKLRLFQ